MIVLYVIVTAALSFTTKVAVFLSSLTLEDTFAFSGMN